MYNDVIKPNDDAPEEEMTTYKQLIRETSIGYAEHIKEFHSNTELPIKRIEEAVANITDVN